MCTTKRVINNDNNENNDDNDNYHSKYNGNVNKHVKKMSWTLKKHFLNTFGIKNGWPARTARNPKNPRPVFDDKNCLKNAFLMSGTFLLHFH